MNQPWGGGPKKKLIQVFSMSQTIGIKARWAGALASSILLWSGAAWATPFIPQSDTQVLERLRDRPLDSITRELRQMRAELNQSPQNLKLAVSLAKRYIEQGRQQADPRYNGYAQAALASWWEQPQPPPAVLVLRATLRQSRHDFDGALVDLNQATKVSPRDPQAWVTRALIQQAKGNYPEAKRDCVPLFRLSTRLVGVTCLSSIASLNGQAQQSYQLLERVLADAPSATTDEKLWARTTLAEIAMRRGQAQTAEKQFKQAIALGPDSYLFGIYADFLLSQGRPQEVVTLLKDQTRVDNLLLRLTLAEQALKAQTLADHVAVLRDRFAASRQRGDTVHQREEAIYTLRLLNKPSEALKLAQANWQIQREPADTRILLESALAAQEITAAKSALDWLAQARTEDVALTKLRKQLGGKA
jgi:tetratricopeptide (TPR) repeat protein